MSTTLERIRHDIRSLSQDELELLLGELQETYSFPGQQSVEEEWDEVINARAKDVLEGRVKMIPGDEFMRHMQDRVASLKSRHQLA